MENKNELDRLVIRGFKSIREMELGLRDINVLIGPNGAGKSNFIAFFRMLNDLIEERLQVHVAKGGGADAFLYYGSKTTSQMEAELYFGNNGYFLTLEPTSEDAFVFSREVLHFSGVFFEGGQEQKLGSGYKETRAPEAFDKGGEGSIASYVVPSIRSWKVYHFHDTSPSAPVKKTGDIHVNDYLRPDAGNLAAFLYLLREKYPSHYRRIRTTIQQVVPFFGDFLLEPEPLNEDKIRLKWREKDSNYPFLADQLSDGTLRFMCLATLLLQPELPSTILIDEPELGLHPASLTVLGDLIHEAARKTQVILSTQSVSFVNEFSPQDIVTVDRRDGQSVFQRHNEEELAYWLEEYSLAEIWEKNIIGGRP